MKKWFLIFLCVCFSFVSVGCESETALQAGHLSEITAAQSQTYAVKIMLDDDERINEKFVDLQLMSEKDEQVLTVFEESGDKFTVCFPKKDYWYNLTYLIGKSNGVSGEASYLKCEDFGNRVYNFTTQNDVKITMRLVAGNKKVNAETGEEILVLSEEISKELPLKMKKLEQK